MAVARVYIQTVVNVKKKSDLRFENICVYVPVAVDYSCPAPSPGPPGNQASDWCWQACGCRWEGACCRLKTEEEGEAWASWGYSCLKQILERQRHSQNKVR